MRAVRTPDLVACPEADSNSDLLTVRIPRVKSEWLTAQLTVTSC